MSLGLINQVNDRMIVKYDDRPLCEYVYQPDMPASESSKPYMCPIYTLAGDDVTVYRATDHPWHKGLQMTLTVVNDQNFWGGNTYVAKEKRHLVGQPQLPIHPESRRRFNMETDEYTMLDNIGRAEHVRWNSATCTQNAIHLEHEVQWITAHDDLWLEETRSIQIGVNPDAHCWTMTWDMHFKNVSGMDLELGTPTTEGRPNAGYSGLFWRGPRSFRDSSQMFAGSGLVDAENIRGTTSPWVACTGRHDGSMRYSTLVFQDHPDNVRYPTKWFVRQTPYACASYAFMFDEVFTLQPNAALNLQYTIVIADGAWTQEQVGEYLGQ